MLGIDQPTMELTIIPYNGIQYAAGIGAGRALKLAVKLPNLVTLKVAAVSFDIIPKVFKNDFS